MTDPIRRTCDHCGELYFPTSQRDECPHEYNTTFTRGAMKLLRDLLHREENGE